MAIQTTYTLDNSVNYLYDNSKINIESGEAKLIAEILGAEALMYAKLDENKGLVAVDSSGNNNHGGFQGGLDETDWVTGKINSAIRGVSATTGFINFNGQIEFERDQAFSLECWVKFTSTAAQYLISKQGNTGNFVGFALVVTGGKARLIIRDNIGNRLVIESLNTCNDDNWHHLVATYDGSSEIGGCKLYVDNVLSYTVVLGETLTQSITTTADFQISGRAGNNNCILDTTYIDEVLVYARELTPAEIEIRWNDGNGTQVIPGSSTTYPTDNPAILPFSNIQITSLDSIGATITTTGLDSVKFTLVLNAIETYWDGTNWIPNTTGYAQSNTLAEINANLPSLVINATTNFTIKAYLHSETGGTTPTLSDFSFSYGFVTIFPTLIPTVINGTLLEFDSSAKVTNISVRTRHYLYGTQTTITSDPIAVTLNSDSGEFTVTIYTEDVEPDNLIWKFGNKKITTNFLPGIREFTELLIE